MLCPPSPAPTSVLCLPACPSLSLRSPRLPCPSGPPPRYASPARQRPTQGKPPVCCYSYIYTLSVRQRPPFVILFYILLGIYRIVSYRPGRIPITTRPFQSISQPGPFNLYHNPALSIYITLNRLYELCLCDCRHHRALTADKGLDHIPFPSSPLLTHPFHQLYLSYCHHRAITADKGLDLPSLRNFLTQVV